MDYNTIRAEVPTFDEGIETISEITALFLTGGSEIGRIILDHRAVVVGSCMARIVQCGIIPLNFW